MINNEEICKDCTDNECYQCRKGGNICYFCNYWDCVTGTCRCEDELESIPFDLPCQGTAHPM